MAVLEAKNLTKKFHDFTAVSDVSFSLKEGEILGFLGPNGAGKTTTIQMLLGILTPTEGEVTYFGKNLQKYRSEIMEKVNFSSTYTNLPWWMTVQENLTFISYLYELQERKKRLEEMVDVFRLREIFRKKMMDLSSGQLTRVNLAKAFLNKPKVLLLDEPTASLDIEVAKYIRSLLLEKRNEWQLSIVITSHNMSEVEELCDRVIVINHGKIIADDSPSVLAQSITVSRVELLIRKKIKSAEEFFRKQTLSYEKDGNFLTISVPAKEIPEFLRKLQKAKIEYTEISIDKPTLEDYFLEAIKEKHEDK